MGAGVAIAGTCNITPLSALRFGAHLLKPASTCVPVACLCCCFPHTTSPPTHSLTTPLLSTLPAFLQANQVSCVGVVSHSQGGGLAAQLSAQVLRGLLPQHFSALAAPVMTFLSSQAASSAAGKPSGGRGSPGGPAQAAGLKVSRRSTGGPVWTHFTAVLVMMSDCACTSPSARRSVLVMMSSCKCH
jgi:hypothetical protein